MTTESADSRLLDLPADVLERVYDALEIEGRTCLNAALPASRRVRRTLRTDEATDARLRVVSRYMKRPGNAGKRYADLSGRLRGFVAERSLKGDPTIARLFPDAPRVDQGKTGAEAGAEAEASPQAALIAAIRKADAAAIAKICSGFERRDVEGTRALREAICLASPGAFDALRSSGLLETIGVDASQVAFDAVLWCNEPLLSHFRAMSATDDRDFADFRVAVDHILAPDIAAIFVQHTNRKTV